MGYDKFSIDIREVVKLLDLKVSPQSDFNGTSFNVRCPFCNDTKYHMNINTVKNAYSCVKCSGGEKGQGALDLYARVAHGVRCVKGQNSREMYRKLCDDLHIEAPVRSRVQKAQLPEVVEIHRASDEVVDKAYRKTCTVRTCTGAAFPMKRLSETGIEAFRPIFRGSTVTGKRRSSIRS